MRKEPADWAGYSYIRCTNLECASNGSTNAQRLKAKILEESAQQLTRILYAHRQYANAGHGPTSLQKLGEMLEVIEQVELAQ
jgi:hypothetical protein